MAGKKYRERRSSTEVLPLPTPFVGRVSQEDWDACPVVVKSEAVRAWIELSAGIAINFDRRAGRPKYDNSGFYGLHVLQTDIWRRPDSSAAKVAKAEALLASLAEELDRFLMIDDIVETFTPLADAAGLSLVDWIKRYIQLERTLKDDLVLGIFQVCDLIGADPIAVLSEAARR